MSLLNRRLTPSAGLVLFVAVEPFTVCEGVPVETAGAATFGTCVGAALLCCCLGAVIGISGTASTFLLFSFVAGVFLSLTVGSSDATKVAFFAGAWLATAAGGCSVAAMFPACT